MKLIVPVKSSEIANILGVKLLGEDIEVTGINEIHKVIKGDLTFVDVAKYYKKALESSASVILINAETDIPNGKALLVSDDPFRDFNRLINEYSRVEKSFAYRQNGANYLSVEKTVIDPSTKIYPGVVIGNHVTIGKNCVIYPNVVIYDNAVIGEGVIIHSGSIIGAHAYYYKKRPLGYDKLISSGRVVIENSVEIGALCTIDKGVSGDTVIGEGTKLDNQVHVGHGVVIGKNCLIGAQVGIGGKTIIENDVIIWGQAGVTKDIRIGKGAVISAQSGVSKSLEGGKSYFGTPAREIREIQREMAWLRGKMKE